MMEGRWGKMLVLPKGKRKGKGRRRLTYVLEIKTTCGVVPAFLTET